MTRAIEVTDFKDVNEGLLKLTKQAADSDVFQYTIKNKGTVNGDVLGSDIQTPTYDYYTRANDDADTTQTTKLTGKSFDDTDAIYLRAIMSDGSLWDKDNARIGAYLSGGGNTDKSILADDVPGVEHYYRIPLGSYTSVKLLRINKNYDVDQLPIDGDISATSGNVWNSSQIVTLNRGSTYSISKNNWNSSYEFTSELREYIEYSTNNFTPGATDNGQDNPVKDTNYIWKEAYASKNNGSQADDAIDDTLFGMTNTTDGNGNFWLMYGTKYVENVTTEKESSAEFIKQFKVDNDTPSVMTVTQNGTLSAPSHPTTSPAEFAAGSRNVSTYYDTDVTATDTAGNDITFTNSGGNTVFDYKNAAGTTASAVRITETFTNTVNVGAITVQKKILKPGSDPAEYLDEDTATFTFRVQLKKVFGVSGLNVGTTNSPYTDVSATKLKSDSNEDTDFTGMTQVSNSGEYYGQFTLKNGEKLTISGIPVGTEYKITETATSDSNYQQNSTTMSDFETVTKGTLTNGISSVVGNNETIVNVRQTGTLKLAKSLGDFAAINGKTVGTPFKFNVTLTVPEGVDLTDYISDLKSFGDYNHTDGTQIYSFSKTVYDNGSTVDISGIPYGTTFLVSEDSESSAGTVSTPSEVSEPNSDPANTIDEAETTVTITNNYPAILNLQKAVTGDAPILSETFTFNVKLTGLTGTPTIKKVVTDENSVTTETVIDNPADFDVDIKSTDTVKITGIPKNTTYTVSEPDQPENWSIDNSNSEGLTGTFNNAAITTIPTAKITNTYTKPRKILTLQKVDSSRNNALVTFSDASKGAQFVLLRLKNAFNLENDSSDFQNLINQNKYTDSENTYVDTVYNNNGSNYSTGTSGQFDITESVSFEFGDYYYFFYEVTAPEGYQKNNSVAGKIFKVDEWEKTVAYPNMPNSTDVTAKKEDQDTKTGLPGAEFDLYYKPTAKRTTYTINESETSPKLMASTSLNPNTIEPTGVYNETTITTPKYNYTAAEAPSASESSWILPRTDNDYIFFRDYEPGTADYDPGLDKHAWLWTGFETNVYGQQKEIKYDHSYWYAAQFSGSGKSTVQYAVWERFVDRYDGRDTIIWKIQPPDGYTKVRFLLYHNNDCIRTTKEFTYKLGKLYTKTSWGGIYSNGNYYEVPVGESNWSTYYNANQTTTGSSNTIKDSRLASTTNLYQADRYVATPQKVVFHCNCKTVWHNIHIEFFSDSAGEHPVGQAFPGYMMEPYAYANNEYRISGYLTYELTIPDGANYFRINDGVTNGGTYGYYTKITRLYNENNNPLIEGKRAMEYKNYHNYFKIDSGDVNNTQNLKLKTWSNSFIKSVGDDPNKIYSDNNAIESDYDYVYFAAPSTWGNHIYAYFYGGGNLREDNWQRACYSIWPGVEPVGTEYKADEAGTDDVEHHSDIYTYSYTGDLYGGTTSATPTNPDSTFAWGDYTVYKFRVPLGDRTNYSKVIFNNGLSKWNGGKETGVITYHSGYLYKKNGSSEKFYDEKPTYVYTGRGDNLYVRISGTDFTTSGTDLYNWDDLHVVFYYSNNQAIQGGKGYVMKYSGTKDGYTYYSVPIPENAVSFTVNNGKNKSSPHNKSISTKYEILPLDEDGDENLTQTFTKGNMVYTLASDALTKTAPLFSDSGTTETISSDTPNPSPRGDYVYIKDETGSTLSTTPPTFIFYDSNNTVLTSPTVNTHLADGSAKWYSVGIPLNATKFEINGGSAEYPIYEKKAEGTSDNFTPGGMYYKALTNQTLEILWPTFTTTTGATNNTDDSWGSNARGDALYLVCNDVSGWYNGTDTIMTVTFYNESGQAIKNGTKSDIKANYIGDLTSANPGVSGSSTSVEDAVGSWFKVNIPKDAVSFEVKYGSPASKTTVKGDIYEKRNKTSSYRNDYTLGDMQYRILNTQTGGKYDLERFYPLFNESETYTLEVSDSKTIDSSAGITLVDEEEVEPYIDAAVATPVVTENGTTDSLVLHATSSNTITYTWQEGQAGDGLLRFNDTNTGWGTVYATFYKSDNTRISREKMTADGTNQFKVGVPSIDNYPTLSYVVFSKQDASDTDIKTGHISLTSTNTYGKNKIFNATKSTNGTRSYLFWEPITGYANNQYCEFFTSNSSSSLINYPTTSPWNNYIQDTNLLKYNTDDGPNKQKVKIVKIPENATYVRFACSLDQSDNRWTDIMSIDSITKGKGLSVTNATAPVTTTEFDLQTYNLNDGSISYSGALENYTGSGTTEVIYSSQFQPEDRYGYIGTTSNMYDTNGTGNTTNNFVKVVDEYDDNGTTKHYLTDPHILFYSDNGTTPINTNVTGTSQNNYGIKLNPDTTPASYPNIDGTKYAAYGNGTTATPYLVRLPKNAKYAKIFDGNTLVGSIVALTDSDGKTGGITLTVTKPESDKIVTATHPDRGSAEIQTAQKKTDIDYIYFTDVNSTMGSNIRAYYFGDTAGEFSPWPGVAPSYSYTDNSGNTVYVFQPPTVTGNTAKSYPYVMFNDGSVYGTAKMTEAKPYTSAGNYKLNSAGLRYGTTVPTANTYSLTNAQSSEVKTSSPTVDFNSTNTNGKYIFFVDNGPKNLTTAELAGTHTPLDDVHIIFYSDAAGRTPVGTADGYVMDNLSRTYTKKDDQGNPLTGATSGTVYRMAIPNDAKYFKITNGVGKGTGESVNERSSVVTKISQNGLYQFVDSTTIIDKENDTTPSSVSDYWNSEDTPAAASNLNDHQYYLELINEREPEEEEDDAVLQEENEIHLATIVTGTDGKQDYIKWLKLNNEGTEVDWRYLDHTVADIYDPVTKQPKIKTVKVIKTGSYYWVESKAPNGYEPDEIPTHPFTVTGNESKAVSKTIQNKKSDTPTNKITLTKTAKEKVGDTDIGSLLGNAQFLLYVNDGNDDDDDDTLAGAFSLADGEYTYGSGTVNTGTNYLITGNDDSDTNHYGKLVLKGLPAGDYYFKEINAPDDYSAIDSNTGTNKRVYFSIGDNTVEKEISCTDEMDAAYIRLFEHISEKKAAWGDPTFIFKITNTASGAKASYVALTVNDDGTITDTTNHRVLKWIDSGTEQPFTADPINDTLYKNWLVEATSETEYKGMYHIDSQGRIKVEPGTYSITRVPVSRYEFVTSGNLVYTTDTEPTGTYTVNSSGTESAETVTLTAGQTGDIHYYDKVGYYDKFSQVDEKVNKFYKLESGANKTIKGIRIADYHSTATSGELALTGSDLTIYAIYADGTEGELNSTEKAKITFSYTDVDDEPAPFTPDISSDNKTLTVSDVADYKGNVYTITATYPYDSDTNFTAKFDLVFSRT